MSISQKGLILLMLIFLTSCSLNNDYLPKEFMGFQLTKKLTGDEARGFINKLHKQTVAETENEIGFYKGDAGNALIYIAHYKKSKDAEEYYDKMIKKISMGNSMFISPEYVEINGKKVYRTFGMSQSHYIFLHNKELFWISVGTLYGKKFVQEYLYYLKRM